MRTSTVEYMMNAVSKRAPITSHCRSLKVKKKKTEDHKRLAQWWRQWIMLCGWRLTNVGIVIILKVWKTYEASGNRKLSPKRENYVLYRKKKLFPSFISYASSIYSFSCFVWTHLQMKTRELLHCGFGLALNLALMQIKRGILYTQN